MPCRGLCVSKYGANPGTGGAGKGYNYAAGFKRCNVCGVWAKWEGLRCPCCRNPLRVHRRNQYAAQKPEVARY